MRGTSGQQQSPGARWQLCCVEPHESSGVDGAAAALPRRPAAVRRQPAARHRLDARIWRRRHGIVRSGHAVNRPGRHCGVCRSDRERGSNEGEGEDCGCRSGQGEDGGNGGTGGDDGSRGGGADGSDTMLLVCSAATLEEVVKNSVLPTDVSLYCAVER
ncbi:unnamed protein product [Phaeothamnion confervicola]